RLKDSLVKIEATKSGRVWKFAHPTIAESYADIVSEDPQKIEYYLLGAHIDRIIGEVTCGRSVTFGGRINVPVAYYPSVIERLGGISDAQKLYTFLAFKCGKLFLREYLRARKLAPLDLRPPGGMLSAYRQVDVFIRLAEFELTTEKDEEKFIEH